MLLCADVGSADADLASGAITCPSCGGRLGPWGHGRERAVRLHYGERAVVRPPRGRCRSCRATHMLLPSWMAPRRADGAGVIARAAAAAALHGTGSARLGADLGVPAATVRGWLRRLRSRAEDLRQDATAALGVITAGRDWPCLAPCGSPLAMPWPRSSRARGPRSPAMATPRRTSTRSSASSASPPPSRRTPAANRQVPSRASPCPHPGRQHTPGTSIRFPRRVHRHHERHDDTPSTPPGEMPEMRTPCAHLQ